MKLMTIREVEDMVAILHDARDKQIVAARSIANGRKQLLKLAVILPRFKRIVTEAIKQDSDKAREAGLPLT